MVSSRNIGEDIRSFPACRICPGLPVHPALLYASVVCLAVRSEVFCFLRFLLVSCLLPHSIVAFPEPRTLFLQIWHGWQGHGRFAGVGCKEPEEVAGVFHNVSLSSYLAFGKYGLPKHPVSASSMPMATTPNPSGITGLFSGRRTAKLPNRYNTPRSTFPANTR